MKTCVLSLLILTSFQALATDQVDQAMQAADQVDPRTQIPRWSALTQEQKLAMIKAVQEARFNYSKAKLSHNEMLEFSRINRAQEQRFLQAIEKLDDFLPRDMGVDPGEWKNLMDEMKELIKAAKNPDKISMDPKRVARVQALYNSQRDKMVIGPLVHAPGSAHLVSEQMLILEQHLQNWDQKFQRQQLTIDSMRNARRALDPYSFNMKNVDIDQGLLIRAWNMDFPDKKIFLAQQLQPLEDEIVKNTGARDVKVFFNPDQPYLRELDGKMKGLALANPQGPVKNSKVTLEFEITPKAKKWAVGAAAAGGALGLWYTFNQVKEYGEASAKAKTQEIPVAPSSSTEDSESHDQVKGE